jgi:hypothetical protein
MRAKLLNNLDVLFQLAFSIAKGNVKQLVDENGAKHNVTLKQRHMWGRLATYTAQVMQNLSKGFDDKQFQTDLKRLERMVDEIKRRQARERDRTVV